MWGEKLAGQLKPLHLIFFWLGFAADTTGTTLMGILSGGWTLSTHGITGAAALIIMAAHALWATVVLLRKQERWRVGFHRFSLAAWAVWLIPYGIGVAQNIHL